MGMKILFTFRLRRLVPLKEWGMPFLMPFPLRTTASFTSPLDCAARPLFACLFFLHVVECRACQQHVCSLFRGSMRFIHLGVKKKKKKKKKGGGKKKKKKKKKKS